MVLAARQEAPLGASRPADQVSGGSLVSGPCWRAVSPDPPSPLGLRGDGLGLTALASVTLCVNSHTRPLDTGGEADGVPVPGDGASGAALASPGGLWPPLAWNTEAPRPAGPGRTSRALPTGTGSIEIPVLCLLVNGDPGTLEVGQPGGRASRRPPVRGTRS